MTDTDKKRKCMICGVILPNSGQKKRTCGADLCKAELTRQIELGIIELSYIPNRGSGLNLENRNSRQKKADRGCRLKSSNRGNYMKVDSMLPLGLNGCQEISYLSKWLRNSSTISNRHLICFIGVPSECFLPTSSTSANFSPFSVSTHTVPLEVEILF